MVEAILLIVIVNIFRIELLILFYSTKIINNTQIKQEEMFYISKAL